MNTHSFSKLLDTDFCPWANRYVYWVKTPLGILVVAGIASFVCGFFVAPQGLVIAATIFVTIVLGIVWPWVGLRGISCELRFSGPRCKEGQRARVEVTIRNSWPFPVWGLGIEEGFFLPQRDGDNTAVALSGIRGWSKTKFYWDFEPERRGIYPTANAKIATEFPFGIWKTRREIETTGKLVVWPRIVSLQPIVLPDGENRSLLRSSDKQTGNEGDRIGVRAYRQGDSLRFVHWAQTAKCGRLIVSERQGPAQSCAVVAIETDPELQASEEAQQIFDSLVRIAGSIAEQLTSQNVNVRMVANDDCWEVDASDLSRQASFDRLAALAPDRGIDPNALGHSTTRFLVTASRRQQAMGRDWRAIVVASGNGSSPEMESSDAWIEVDSNADPLGDFAVQWTKKVRFAWKSATRKREVA